MCGAVVDERGGGGGEEEEERRKKRRKRNIHFTWYQEWNTPILRGGGRG